MRLEKTDYIASYAGIGTRNLTSGEEKTIREVAALLAKMKFLLYSGNCDGADVCFQQGSGIHNVAFLPWDGFGKTSFDYTKHSVAHYVMGNSKDGLDSVVKFHPNPHSLSRGGRSLMARNYHQIHGVQPDLPVVSFVVCCATPKGNEVEGGTGQAVRIALSLNIPIINIRVDGWNKKLKEVCSKILVA